MASLPSLEFHVNFTREFSILAPTCLQQRPRTSYNFTKDRGCLISPKCMPCFVTLWLKKKHNNKKRIDQKVKTTGKPEFLKKAAAKYHFSDLEERITQNLSSNINSTFSSLTFQSNISKEFSSTICRSSEPSNSSVSNDESTKQGKVPFGYTRKDVILIGLGVTVGGIALESGLEYLGVDPLQAGNVVQLVLVLGLTIGWISTYIFRVSNKEMTYAQQLRDYENKVMEKRLEGLTEAELEALLEQVEEEKRTLASGEQVK